MGYDLLTFNGWARVSRHNSSRDNADNSRWNEFVEKLHALTAEYPDIDLDASAYPIEGYPDYGG